MNKLFAIVGESCVGKNAVLENILGKIDIPVLVSSTTRPIRSTEKQGREYNFTTKEEFTKHHKNNDILEYSAFTVTDGSTWFYYTLKSDLKLDKTSQIKIVDAVGKVQLKQQLKNKMVTIYITCDENTRRKRYLNRCESPDNVEDRILRDKESFKNLKYDYKVNNDGSRSITEVATEVLDIIKKEMEK